VVRSFEEDLFLEMAPELYQQSPKPRIAAAASGVLDGEYHFVEDAGGYR
jgi:hypothetical protein